METVAYVIFDAFDDTYRCTNKGFGFFNKDFRNAIFFWTKEAAEKDTHYDKTRHLILSVNLALEDVEENMKKNGEWDE